LPACLPTYLPIYLPAACLTSARLEKAVPGSKEREDHNEVNIVQEFFLFLSLF